MKDKRFFICNDTLSTIAVKAPDKNVKWDNEYEVTMRDCSRQIHWLFPTTRAGLVKAKKVATFYSQLADAIEESLQEKKKK